MTRFVKTTLVLGIVIAGLSVTGCAAEENPELSKLLADFLLAMGGGIF